MSGKLNVITDRLSQQWEGQPRDAGIEDGSSWIVSEDWGSERGLINDIQMTTVAEPQSVSKLIE